MLRYKHQHGRPYYEDLYDKFTVKECRDWIRIVLEDKLPEKAKKFSKKDQMKLAACVIDLPIFSITGERYLKREKTIEEWMADDRKKDEFVASHPAPNAYCPKCNQKMEVMIDELDLRIDDDDLRMLYLYKCNSCGEKMGTYSDGHPYVFKENLCPKCSEPLGRKHKKLKNKIITSYSCPKCDYREKEVYDFNKKEVEEKPDPNFEEDRAKYCLTKEKGEEYRRFKDVELPQLEALMAEVDQKEKDKEYYELAKKIKRLTVNELSDLLAKELLVFDYKGLMITNTDMSRDLVLTFTIQDAKSGRTESASCSDLKKAIKKVIENTNWRLMTEGVTYKLGLLTGRLRGIDDEKTLVNDLKNNSLKR